MNETLADKAVSTLAIISEVDRMLSGVNDIGEHTGYCDECSSIINDTHAVLGMIRARAYNLKKRIERGAATTTVKP